MVLVFRCYVIKSRSSARTRIYACIYIYIILGVLYTCTLLYYLHGGGGGLDVRTERHPTAISRCWVNTILLCKTQRYSHLILMACAVSFCTKIIQHDVKR